MARDERYNPGDVLGVTWATVLIGTKEAKTPFPNISNFKFDDKATYPTDFAPIGLTSRESLPSMSTDGGEETALDTAELKSVESLSSGKSYSLAFTVHSFSKESLRLAFGGDKAESQKEANGSLIQGAVSGDNAVERPVLVIYSGGGKKVGLYYPRVKVSGATLSEASMESLLSLSFSGKVLQPTSEHMKEIEKVASGIGSSDFYIIRPTAAVTAAPGAVPGVVPGG